MVVGVQDRPGLPLPETELDLEQCAPASISHAAHVCRKVVEAKRLVWERRHDGRREHALVEQVVADGLASRFVKMNASGPSPPERDG